MTYIINDYYYIPYELLSRISNECVATYKGSFIATKILSRYTDFLKNKIGGSNVTKDWILRLMYEFIKDNVYTIKDDEPFDRDPLDGKDDAQVGAVKMFTQKLLSEYDLLREAKLNGTFDKKTKDISMTHEELSELTIKLTNEFSDWEQKCNGISPTGANYWDGKRIGALELQQKIMKKFSENSSYSKEGSGNKCASCGCNKNPKIKEDVLQRLKKLMNIGQFSFENLREFEAVLKKIEEEL